MPCRPRPDLRQRAPGGGDRRDRRAQHRPFPRRRGAGDRPAGGDAADARADGCGPARPGPGGEGWHEDRDPGCRRRRRLFRRAAGGPRQRRHLHRPRRPCRRRCASVGCACCRRPATCISSRCKLHEDWRTHRAGRHRPGRGQDVRPRGGGAVRSSRCWPTTPPSCRSRTASRRRRSSSVRSAGAMSAAGPPTSPLRSRRRA